MLEELVEESSFARISSEEYLAHSRSLLESDASCVALAPKDVIPDERLVWPKKRIRDEESSELWILVEILVELVRKLKQTSSCTDELE